MKPESRQWWVVNRWAFIPKLLTPSSSWFRGCIWATALVLGGDFSNGVLREADPLTPGTPTPSQAIASPLPALPVSVDLRPIFEQQNLSRRQQGERPTCSAFTVAGALEYAVAKLQGKTSRLSVEFLNWAANKTCGDRRDGGFFSDLWKGFATYGICKEGDLPYRSAFDPNQSPPPEALADARARLSLGLRLHWIKEWNVNTGLTEAHLMAIKQTLHAGWPVCGGFRWPKREEWVEEVLQWCPADAVRDGHSVLLVGYRDEPTQPGGGVLIFRNTARRGRDGYMPYSYAQAYMNDAAWIDYDEPDPSSVDHGKSRLSIGRSMIRARK